MSVYRRKDTKSKRWFYKFEIDGVTYKKSIPTARTKPQALAAERQARQDIHDGCYQTQRANILFTEFVEKVYLPWAETNHRPNTKDRIVLRYYCEVFKGLPLRQISTMLIEGKKQARAKMLTQYGTPFKSGTINLEIDTLSGVFTMAVEYKYRRDNPCLQVARLEVSEESCRYLLPDEEARLMVELDSDRGFLKPLVQAALWTGFRQCELIALCKQSVDFARNRIFVTNPKWKKDSRKTKGNPMNDETRELLLRLSRDVKGDRFFVHDRTGEPLTRGVIDQAFRRALRLAGIVDFRFHDLRHTFGTRLGDADVSLEKIARLMGHSSLRTTRIYVHPTDEGLQRAVDHAPAKPAEESTRIVPGRFKETGESSRKALQATG